MGCVLIPLFVDRNPARALVQYDPSLARRLFEEAGWRDENGEGVRERDGEEFSFRCRQVIGLSPLLMFYGSL